MLPDPLHVLSLFQVCPMTGHPTWTNGSNLNVILSYESVLHSQTDTNKSCLTIKLTVIVLILVYL